MSEQNAENRSEADDTSDADETPASMPLQEQNYDSFQGSGAPADDANTIRLQETAFDTFEKSGDAGVETKGDGGSSDPAEE